MRNPQPATRREFLRHGIGLIGFGATVPTFLTQSMRLLAEEKDGASVASRPGMPDERVLVVVHLAGGNDGLNTIVPFHNDDYYRARPRLAIPSDKVLKINEEFGFHSEAAGLKQLWDDGRLCVVHGVGYPNPNRSHFVSTRIWHTASPEGNRVDGWIGRYFDNCCAGQDPPKPISGIAIEEEVPAAMRGQRFMPICTNKPEVFGVTRGRRERRLHDTPDKLDASNENLFEEAATSKTKQTGKSESNLDFLRRSALDAALSAEQIRLAARKPIEGERFPQSEFGRQLESIAHMIAADLPTKIYYVSLGGFDTHANQLDRHARVLREGASALAAFVHALQQSGDLSRTLVMTFSEFGRRVAENASAGTDHGQAAPMFLIGDQVRPGFHGAMPRLDQLNLGDQVFRTDFRQVYATILRDWLVAKPERVLDRQWSSLPLLK